MLAIIGNVALSTIKTEGGKPSKTLNQLKVDGIIEKQKQIEVISCIEEPTSVYSGSIDVSYVKSLIDKLKENSLEESDEKEIEEFELFIINFVNRQPNGYERKKMSEYMGSLIKKLAKYTAIEKRDVKFTSLLNLVVYNDIAFKHYFFNVYSAVN